MILKRLDLLALFSFLLIPFVSLFGGLLFCSIDPEIARHTADYVRNYRLIELIRHFILWGTLGFTLGMWFLTFFLLIKSKKRSSGWLVLAFLGPFGMILLNFLEDKDPGRWNRYSLFVGKFNFLQRTLYETGLLFFIWISAEQGMLIKRYLGIAYESWTTGVSKQQILDQQNASSGMWAFSEGLEVFFLVILFYILCPFTFNLTGSLWDRYKKKGTNP